MQETTTTIECDVSNHTGDRLIAQPIDPKKAPLVLSLPNGGNFVACGVCILANAPSLATELDFNIRQSIQAQADAEVEKAQAFLISHRAELRKRNTARA